ncbi:MAG TPA: hemerythrin domain-containing protein [Chitinispirillaceae bacterium]|nr:hemerythrin domain-containing protein [Chitinispirillaceae bacterium]
MIKPIESLEHEHRIIEKVLMAIFFLVEKINSGKDVDTTLLKKIHEFMIIFADRCHHGKEENHLFKTLDKIGIAGAGYSLSSLIYEHQKSRALVAQISRASNAINALPAFQGIIDLYPGHIWKEENLIFPKAENILSAGQLNKLDEDFENVENELGPDIHKKYESLAEELMKQSQII